MKLQERIMQELKTAMKAKDKIALESLRAVKSALLLANTSGKGEDITEKDEIQILQKLVKQRKESADIFKSQNRDDLADLELAQAEIIQQFLPEQLSEDEIKQTIQDIVDSTGATSMKDMGKVMGMASSKMSGKADGKIISNIVKSLLS